MSLNSRMRTWWRAMTHSAEVDAQVEEELRFHIESYAEDLMRGGMGREEAMRRAKSELGSMTAVRENSRQAWGTGWFDELRGDLRYAANADEESGICGDCHRIAGSRNRREYGHLYASGLRARAAAAVS